MQPTKEIKDSITILDKYTGVEFPLNSYPIRIREICDHLHEVRGTPKEMLYSCAIGIIAGIVGNKYRVENLHPSYTQTLNQYFLGIGNSSAGKSTAVDPLIFTILDKEREFMREYKKNKRQGLNPIDPRRIIENATQEGLFKRMAETNYIFSLSTEARQILSIICGEYKKSGNEFSFYNIAWDGNKPYSVDRAGKDSIYIEKAFLSALWLAQPDVIKSFMKENINRENGFLQRLLFFKTDLKFQRLEKNIPELDNRIKSKWDNFILKLYLEKEDKITTIRGIKEAQQVIIDYYNSFEELAHQEVEIYNYLSKSTEKACRLAGVLALCDNKVEIDKQTTYNACKIIDYSNSILLDFIVEEHKQKAQELRERIIDTFNNEDTTRLFSRTFQQKRKITLEQLEETAKRFPNDFEFTTGPNPKSKIMILKQHNQN